MEAQRDEGFPGPRGRPEDDVLPRHDLEERLLLGRVEREATGGDPVEEEAEYFVRVVRPAGRDSVREGHGGYDAILIAAILATPERSFAVLTSSRTARPSGNFGASTIRLRSPAGSFPSRAAVTAFSPSASDARK